MSAGQLGSDVAVAEEGLTMCAPASHSFPAKQSPVGKLTSRVAQIVTPIMSIPDYQEVLFTLTQ